MKIGLSQYSPDWEDKEFNKAKLTSLLQEEVEDVDLLIFPEMTLTGFTMRSKKYAEKLDGESFKYFGNVAKNFECDVSRNY